MLCVEPWNLKESYMYLPLHQQWSYHYRSLHEGWHCEWSLRTGPCLYPHTDNGRVQWIQATTNKNTNHWDEISDIWLTLSQAWVPLMLDLELPQLFWFKRFISSLHHQKYKSTGLDTTWTTFSLFGDCITWKFERDKILKSGNTLRNLSGEKSCKENLQNKFISDKFIWERVDKSVDIY